MRPSSLAAAVTPQVVPILVLPILVLPTLVLPTLVLPPQALSTKVRAPPPCRAPPLWFARRLSTPAQPPSPPPDLSSSFRGCGRLRVESRVGVDNHRSLLEAGCRWGRGGWGGVGGGRGRIRLDTGHLHWDGSTRHLLRCAALRWPIRRGKRHLFRGRTYLAHGNLTRRRGCQVRNLVLEGASTGLGSSSMRLSALGCLGG